MNVDHHEVAVAGQGDVVLDAPLRAAIGHALTWATEQGLFRGQAATAERACLNAATYARLCAPSTATTRQLELATTFTVLFFWLDDADPVQLAELTTTPGPPSPPRIPALARWCEQAHELEHCQPSLRAAWLDSSHRWLAALVAELAIDRERIGVSQQLELRRDNAFIDPYLDLWLALLDVVPTQADPTECARARWLARELIILANDLGSLARDLAAHDRAELNLVITMARERGCSHAEATAVLVEQHDALAVELGPALSSIAAVGGANGRAYAELLREVVAGNVAAMRVLAERYAGSTALLDALVIPR
jgi:Terpene synthase family 2, C-terminal metal binding